MSDNQFHDPIALLNSPKTTNLPHELTRYYTTPVVAMISLRDYFAAAALPQVDQRSHGTLDEIALECYQIADAMLAAREVKP